MACVHLVCTHTNEKRRAIRIPPQKKYPEKRVLLTRAFAAEPQQTLATRTPPTAASTNPSTGLAKKSAGNLPTFYHAGKPVVTPQHQQGEATTTVNTTTKKAQRSRGQTWPSLAQPKASQSPVAFTSHVPIPACPTLRVWIALQSGISYRPNTPLEKPRTSRL